LRVSAGGMDNPPLHSSRFVQQTSGVARSQHNEW
jgi:hypothetical protein